MYDVGSANQVWVAGDSITISVTMTNLTTAVTSTTQYISSASRLVYAERITSTKLRGQFVVPVTVDAAAINTMWLLGLVTFTVKVTRGVDTGNAVTLTDVFHRAATLVERNTLGTGFFVWVNSLVAASSTVNSVKLSIMKQGNPNIFSATSSTATTAITTTYGKYRTEVAIEFLDINMADIASTPLKATTLLLGTAKAGYVAQVTYAVTGAATTYLKPAGSLVDG